MMAKVKTQSGSRRTVVRFAWLLLAIVAVAGIVYGPELFGLYRLSRQIDTTARDDARTGGKWPRAADACIYCHGVEGNPQAQTYPRLAGQSEVYLRKQLAAFASGERNDPTMTSLALGMSEQERNAFAAHFAKIAPLANTAFKADPVRVERGEALVKNSACVACHGEQLEGKGEFPRLAGQGFDYVRDQLTAFKRGTRHDASGAMPAIVAPLSQRDIEDLAQYVASRQTRS